MKAGDRIDERFVLLGLAGVGGMGEVYRAQDHQSGMLVAIKILRTTGHGLVERFAREVQVLAELEDPRIVGYVAHGETEQGAPYLAMEWLEGESLADRLSRQALSIGEALVFAQQVARALGVAHAAGV